MKTIAIVQSNYIPWKGYFDLIASVDEFVLYDDMQYTRRDWRNRNKVKTSQGIQWVTVPVLVKGKYNQRICDTEIDKESWIDKHWKVFSQNYVRAPFFDEVATWLKPLYYERNFTHLSQLNLCLINGICAYLGIETLITSSSDYKLLGGRTERLAEICLQASATEYISAPAAREYIDEKVFSDRGLNLKWFNYDNYPEYPQLWGEFSHTVSIVDLLFNCGKNSPLFMKHIL